MKSFSKFYSYVRNDPHYQKAFEIVRKNSTGRNWLIGGSISRLLTKLYYGFDQTDYDFDFIVEKAKDNIQLPSSFNSKINSYGNLKFVSGDISIDFVPISTIDSIKRRGLQPTIENFLSGTPFTIQAIAYDIDNNQLLGDEGLQAFSNRVFDINDAKQAKRYARKKGLDLNTLIAQKATSMGFKPIFVK